jgi:tetratricopeptide (TPR) repeat protein
VSIREVALSTAFSVAFDAGEWDIAMGICERIDQLHVRRGASEHERARLRLNAASVLLQQDRAEAADEMLRQCQAVFEGTQDIALLGWVFRLRAAVQDALGRADEALTLAQAGLRYSYQRANPGDLAAAHAAVASYLADTGYPGQICLAHRMAAAILRAVVAHQQGRTVVESADLLEYGADLFPRTLGELAETVGQLPGVRLDAVLRSLVPGEVDRGELFDSVVAPARRNAGIAQGAMVNYREERAAFVEALERAGAGERSPALFEGLDECSAELLLAFIGLFEKEKAQTAPRPKRQQEDAQPPPQGKPGRRPRFRIGRRARMSREALAGPDPDTGREEHRDR